MTTASCPFCDRAADVWPPVGCEEPEFHDRATFDCDCGDTVTIAEAIASPSRHRRCSLIGSRS